MRATVLTSDGDSNAALAHQPVVVFVFDHAQNPTTKLETREHQNLNQSRTATRSRVLESEKDDDERLRGRRRGENRGRLIRGHKGCKTRQRRRRSRATLLSELAARIEQRETICGHRMGRLRRSSRFGHHRIREGD